MNKMQIGLDIGGTKIEGIVWNGKEVVRELTIATPKTLFEFGHNLSKLIAYLRGKDKVTSLGVSMAGLADKNKKILVSSPNIKYIKNFSFDKFGKSLGFKKISLDNDASCFLSAELALGPLKGNKNVVGIILGTGLGGAFFLNGKIYRGTQNFGGEVGKMYAGSMMTWENEYQKLRDKKDWKRMSDLMTRGLFSLVKIFNPQVFVFGGSVAVKEGRNFLPSVTKHLKGLLTDKQQMPEIVISKLKFSGSIGAVLNIK